MNAIKEVSRLIASNPMAEWSQTLRDLVIALESDQPYKLERLYALDMPTFELAMRIIEEWRLDRYYAKKGKLLDLSVDAKAQADAAALGKGAAQAEG